MVEIKLTTIFKLVFGVMTYYFFLNTCLLSKKTSNIYELEKSFIYIETKQMKEPGYLKDDPLLDHFYNKKLDLKNQRVKVTEPFGGVFIDDDCNILTHGSVFKDKNIEISLKVNGKIYIPKVIKQDVRTSLTILKVPDITSCSKFTLSDESPTKTKVAIGPSFFDQENPVFTYGEIFSITSQYFEAKKNDDWFFLKKDFVPKYDLIHLQYAYLPQGSVALNEKFEIIGIVIFTKKENENLFVKFINVKEINEFINSK